MEYAFQHLKQQNVLLVKTSGEYLTSTDTKFLEKMYQAYAEFGCDKIIIDYRNAQISIDVVIALGRPAIYDSLVGSVRPQKVALVFAELNERYRYFEDVCQNRGWNLIVCADYDFAQTWVAED